MLRADADLVVETTEPVEATVSGCSISSRPDASQLPLCAQLGERIRASSPALLRGLSGPAGGESEPIPPAPRSERSAAAVPVWARGVSTAVVVSSPEGHPTASAQREVVLRRYERM
jgi:hypothetical protein